jgi:hypothetical protein
VYLVFFYILFETNVFSMPVQRVDSVEIDTPAELARRAKVFSTTYYYSIVW